MMDLFVKEISYAKKEIEKLLSATDRMPFRKETHLITMALFTYRASELLWGCALVGY